MKILAPGIDQAIKAETDALGRDSFAQGLLALFERSSDPLVVALDEPWGTGKTVFVRRMLDTAKQQGFKVVYYDAFQRDYGNYLVDVPRSISYIPFKDRELEQWQKSI